MKRFCLLVLGLIVSIFSFAQSVNEIQQYNEAINQQVAQSLAEKYDGPLYHNQWVTNKDSASWPVVGMYSATTDFWYNYPPDILDENDNRDSVLVKINATQRSISYWQNETFLFQKGKLLLYTYRLDEGGDVLEQSIYFSLSGKLLQQVIFFNEKEIPLNDNSLEPYQNILMKPETAIATAKKLTGLFVHSF